jgi:hypothetical protein
MRISRELSPAQVMMDQKRQENMEHFNCVVNMITDASILVKRNPGLPCKAALDRK